MRHARLRLLVGRFGYQAYQRREEVHPCWAPAAGAGRAPEYDVGRMIRDDLVRDVPAVRRTTVTDSFTLK
jgi:hypothetical protein